MASAQDQLRSALLNEFECRRNRNSRYSLRSFARSLGVPPSALSEVLHKNRTITRKMAQRVLPHLLNTGQEQAYELNQFENRQKKSLKVDYALVPPTELSVIAQWHDFAILSLMECDNFRDDKKWIASRLGITANEVEAALKRLKTNGFLEKNKRHLTTGLHTPHYLVQRSHLQTLQLAEASVTKTRPELRDLSFMTVAIDPELLPEAKKKIMKFRRAFTQWIESQGKRQEVYRLAIQLFPITETPQ